jgi:hypothetical protein
MVLFRKVTIVQQTNLKAMKKTLYAIILATMVIPLTLKAQDSPIKFNFGPRLGYTTVKPVFNTDTINASLNSAFNFGLFARIGNKWFFQPEMNFVTKGGLSDYVSHGTVVSTQNIQLKTITVPLLVGRKFMDLKLMSLHFMAGPVASIVTDKKISNILGSDFPVQSKSDLKNLIWSMQVGGGIDVLFLTVDLRYEFGLDNMFKGSNPDFSLKNNIFNVSAGIKF